MKNPFGNLFELESDKRDRKDREVADKLHIESNPQNNYIDITPTYNDGISAFFAGEFDEAHNRTEQYDANRAAAEAEAPARESRLRRAGIALASAALFAAAMTGSYLYVRYTSEVQHDQVEYLDEKLKECKNSIPLDVSADVRFKQELACGNPQGVAK